MKTKLTPFEVIDLIEETYVRHPENRAIRQESNSQVCLYNGLDNKTCAFGFFCNNPKELIENENASTQLNKFGFNILKESVRHIREHTFWSNLQNIHDGTFVTTVALREKLLAKYPELRERYEHKWNNGYLNICFFNIETDTYLPYVSDIIEYLKEKWATYNDSIRVQLGTEL